MLKNSFIILLCMLSFSVKAEVSDPIGVFKKGNQLYENQSYDSALVEYLILENEGLYSSELYQNLGNTYYKLDDIPNAILYFERALKLSPGNEDLIHNLKLCNAQITDKGGNSDSVRLNDWFFKYISKSPNYWAYTSIYLMLFGAILLITFLFIPKPAYKRLSFYAGALAFLLGITSVFFAAYQKSRLTEENTAIIFEPSIELRNEPSETSSAAFVLHEGSKVTLLDQNENWYEVKFADGKIGWLKKEFVKVI